MSDYCICDITIELRSDMCCGTGESDGVAVDQVTALDSGGMPIIPGKRLKGLLREEAEIIADRDTVTSLFGKPGDKHPGKLSFSSARLIGHNEIEFEAKRMDPPVSPNMMAEVFTTMRTSTRIEEDGVVADHSLRTIQLVKRCNSEGVPTRFSCRVSGCGMSEAEKLVFLKIVKCLRSIGMNKTRGLGEVVCSGEWIDNESDAGSEPKGTRVGFNKTIGYRIVLDSGAVLQGGPDGSMDYIPGSVLQGVFAKELSEKDPALFQKHVLRNTKFSNAYLEIATGPDNRGLPTRPVPFTHRTRKNSFGKIDLPLYDSAKSTLSKQAGGSAPVQQVPVNGYGAVIGNKLVVSNVKEAISFHSSKPSSSQGKQFYSLRSIEAGQSFFGTITADSEAIEVFKDAIARRGGCFSIGNACSSGYGACHLSLCEPPDRALISIRVGDRVAVHLVSDVIFFDRYGVNSTDVAAFAEELSASGVLGFEFNASMGQGDDSCKAFVKTLTIGGYNAHWHMPKRQYMAFKKGSVLVCTVTACFAEKVCDALRTGYLQNEGFGELRIERIDALPYSTYSKGWIGCVTSEQPEGICQSTVVNAALNSFKREIAFNRACEMAVLEACKEANERLQSMTSSKSSAMRIGSLFLSVIKSSADTALDQRFETEACSNFSDDDDRALLNACKGAAESYREVEKEFKDILTPAQKRLLFNKYMQAFLHQMKLLYSMSEGGAHE